MVTRKARKIDKGLLKKGFKKREGAKHSVYIFYYSDGTQSEMNTVMSQKTMGRNIDQTLLSSMAKQVGLNLEQFLNLVDCPLSISDYEALLKHHGK